MEIIVISSSIYKEKDAVITAISEDKTVSFYARGIVNPRNKNNFLLTPLTKANISLIIGKIKYPILEKAELIESPYSLESNYEYLSGIMIVSEAINKLLQIEECFLSYNIVCKTIRLLKDTDNKNVIILYFLLKTLCLIGIQLEVKSCVLCGNKNNIVDFSFIHGGFICKKCYKKNERRYTNAQLTILRSILINDGFDFCIEYDQTDINTLIRDLVFFIEDNVGVTLKTVFSFIKDNL